MVQFQRQCGNKGSLGEGGQRTYGKVLVAVDM